MKAGALVFGALLQVAAPAAADSWANGISLYSDRVRRGVSQTDGPGIAGEIKYNTSSGWHAGLWVGTVNYDNVAGESFELLPFLAYDRKIGGLTAEIGVLHHSFFGTNRGIDYDEAELTVTHKLGKGSLSGAVYYRLRSQDGGHSWYWSGDSRFPLGSLEGAKVALGLNAGLYRDPGFSKNNYADASIGLFATKGRAIFGVGMSDSTLTRQSTIPGSSDAGTRLYVSFTRMFRRSH
jgi:uncharacterized protein (TIGR02001 family)